MAVYVGAGDWLACTVFLRVSACSWLRCLPRAYALIPGAT
jgi:hypothetical protein